jgi:hypothetical protein
MWLQLDVEEPVDKNDQRATNLLINSLHNNPLLESIGMHHRKGISCLLHNTDLKQLNI